MSIVSSDATALAGSEERFRVLARHAPVGIFLTDAGGQTLFVNETWSRLAGLAMDEALGNGWLRALHPDDRERITATWEAALRTGSSSDAEYRFLRPDGSMVWLQGSASQIREADGSISGYVGTVVDVTARKRDEERLRQHVARADFIAQLSHRLSALSDPAEMRALALETTGLQLAAQRCYFIEVAESGARLTIAGDWRRPGEESVVGTYEANAYGSDPWWERLAAGPVVVENVAEHPATRDYAAGYHRYGVHSCAAVPFSRDGRWVAALVVTESRPRAWSQDEILLLEHVINRFWPAIERARADDEAHRQAERLNLAVAAARLGDWSWEVATDQMTLSARTCEIFGITPGVPVTRAELIALLHPDDRRRAERVMADSIAAGTDYGIEYRLHHARLGWRWISTRGRVLGGPAGAPVAMIGVIQDITERKEVEERLQEREAELRLISNNAPVMLVHCDRQGRFLFVNRAYAERFGIPAEGLIGRHIGDVIGPAAFAAVRPYVERVLRGEPVEFEIAIPYAQLGTRYMRTSYVPDVGPDGAVRSWLAAISDVTERRAAEESLRERTRTLEILNTVSSALVAEHDSERILQVVSEAAREISGAAFGGFRPLAGDRAIQGSGLPFERSSVLRITDARQLAPEASAAMARWAPAGTEVRSYLAVPVVSRSGEVLGGLFFGHAEPGRFGDDSERTLIGLAAEAAIAIDTAAVYRTLEQRVQERTTSLREAIAQMEEFSYSVSHDLRAPLRAMNGYAQALLDDYGERLDATALGYLERIQRSSQRMEKLTYDLLTYSRIARSEVRPTTVNLDKLVADIINQYVELQPPRSRVEIAGPLGDVRGHDSSLAQAVANLLTNAVKFVPAGTLPRVRVWTTVEKNRVRLWVQDNGIGVRPEHRGRLFQVFERLPTGERFEGTGIGLAIVRKAMEKMGGTCGVESDGRSGSRFWLELPKPGMGQ